MNNHAQKVSDAMLAIAHWLICGKYRTVMHRHDGLYRAIDQGVNPNQSWNAESLVELAAMMRGENKT